jgi:hypothetical protein
MALADRPSACLDRAHAMGCDAIEPYQLNGYGKTVHGPS